MQKPSTPWKEGITSDVHQKVLTLIYLDSSFRANTTSNSRDSFITSYCSFHNLDTIPSPSIHPLTSTYTSATEQDAELLLHTKSLQSNKNKGLQTFRKAIESTIIMPSASFETQIEENMIQFPPEMDENWVRYGLAKLGQISELPNWQRMLFCAYTTQLLHSTGEVCWNNKDSYFIWFEFVCRNSGQIASRRSWKRSCLGLEYTSKCSRLALLWEPN